MRLITEEYVEAGESVVTRETHSYQYGVCTTEDCGHVCSHAARDVGLPVPDGYATDDVTHTSSTFTTWKCLSYGMSGAEASGEGEPEPHSYETQSVGTYKCSVCDHVCKHTGVTVTACESTNDNYEDITTTTHTHKYQQTKTTTCQYCPYVGTNTVDLTRPMRLKTMPGSMACVACSIINAGMTGRSWTAPVASAAMSAHTRSGFPVNPQPPRAASTMTPPSPRPSISRKVQNPTLQTCKLCGKAGKITTKAVTRQENHNWVGGVCRVCIYVCLHGEWIPVESVTTWSGEYDAAAVTVTPSTPRRAPRPLLRPAALATSRGSL